MSVRRGEPSSSSHEAAVAAAPLALVPQRSEHTSSGTDTPATPPSIPTELLPIPEPGDPAAILGAAAAAVARGVSGAMATVLERHGSAPGTPGQKLYFATDGTCIGTVGGGAVERAVLESLVTTAKDPNAKHEVR
ncbi:MAG: Xanthine and dehydrogenase maturation factor, XdhC/CoxF family, partial [Labilithrix sp.]|nr:Xanthine and dehydrogenase maturation factor, XdhC/CoxF family [Labilithrix sp.]